MLPIFNHDMRSDLPLEVEVIEARDLTGDNAKIRLKMKIRFGLNDGIVS